MTRRFDFLAARSEGDARTALERAGARTRHGRRARGGPDHESAGRGRAAARAVLYDKGGDRHYDYISAWIKAHPRVGPDASHVLPRGDLEAARIRGSSSGGW